MQNPDGDLRSGPPVRFYILSSGASEGQQNATDCPTALPQNSLPFPFRNCSIRVCFSIVLEADFLKPQFPFPSVSPNRTSQGLVSRFRFAVLIVAIHICPAWLNHRRHHNLHNIRQTPSSNLVLQKHPEALEIAEEAVVEEVAANIIKMDILH